MSGSGNTVIRLEQVSRHFGSTHAVDQVSLKLRENEFFALLGPSGCGKTTLLRIIAGFERPDRGRIWLDDKDITALRPNRRPVNLMFQSYALFPHMTVWHNVAYGLEMENIRASELKQRVDEMLERVHLQEFARRKPQQLSGGQRQRVALARALVKRPRVLLLDEPLAALDRKLRGQMQLELKRLQHEVGITFVVVTHDQEEALVMADRIALLDRGKIVQVGSPREIYEYPVNRFAADFIGTMNFIEGEIHVSGIRSAGYQLPASITSNAEATLAIRPERIRLSVERDDTLDVSMPGEVSEIAYHGQDLQVAIVVERIGPALLARVSSAAAISATLQPGMRVWCGWQRRDARILADEIIIRGTAMNGAKTIVFFPEAAFGPALNSVGIAQACKALGHNPVFICDPGFAGVFKGYGFEEHHVNMSEPMPPEEMAKYWSDFINGHIPNFGKSPYDQIDNYVKECWEAIVSTSVWAEKELPDILKNIKPDLICIDNVVLFPATKQYGVPWVRIISCSENEIPDPDIPPHLSGCGENDKACFERYNKRFNEVVRPIHRQFNEFLKQCGEQSYPPGEFFEPSPYLNLLLYPEPVKFKRRQPLDPQRFQYLEGCVREEAPYRVPQFKAHNDKPLLYVSFGSLGSGDTELLKRIIDCIGQLPYRALVNVGDYSSEYSEPPANIHLDSWYPQPSVIPLVDAVIHHGGNNSFTECLYFGKPAIIMPYVWDGHDNATRVHETGHGLKMDRYQWSDEELGKAIETLLTDKTMAAKLQKTSAHMQSQDGTKKAARLLDDLLRAQA